jgi:hypothetical protein
MLGKALDFYIPGVKLTKLREAAMKLQGGGVGYYPRSGSPFVHLDVGSVRAWPRMTRQELVRIFPNGKTLHLPADGKPLPGYEVALADYKKRGGAIQSSGGGNVSSSRKSPNLLAALFGGDDEGDDTEDTSVPAAKPARAPAAEPAETEVAALPGVAEQAPAPAAQPATVNAFVPERAPIPVARPRIEQQVSEVALVAPPNAVPAQAQIDAFASAAAAVPANPTETAANVLPDLSKIRAPIPQLLPERAAKPATEVAALAPAANADATGVDLTGNVPTPTSAPVDAQQATRDPFIPLPIRRPGDLPTGAPAADVAVAALEPAKRSARLGAATGFDAAPVARKGARPGISDAVEKQTTSRNTSPVLTETIISTWALTRGRTQTMADPASRGKRFVASQLKAAPREVYAVGFEQTGGALPHDKFTGSAVNFIKVARFTRN